MVFILSLQNPDGGWPYRKGGPSWIEPTAYAWLALAASPVTAGPAGRALAWLREAQRPDGGWPPQPGVPHSTWVTAVVLLLGPQVLGAESYQRGIGWILRGAGRDSSLWSRLSLLLAGNKTPEEQRFPGWPWFPGTTAWVAPTALSILVLRKALRYQPSTEIHRRLQTGSAFLLARVCRDGGWNYGCPRVWGYEAPSRPETTGLALLALHGNASNQTRQACRLAHAQLDNCRCLEAQCWLRLGLLAHAQVPHGSLPCLPARTVQTLALDLLVSAAERGRNAFLE
jgi:Prenyltransferase and squalene oxidase repeat